MFLFDDKRSQTVLYFGFLFIGIYSLFVNPYVGEFVEFGQNISGKIIYSEANAPGQNRIAEQSGLIILAAVFVEFLPFLSPLQQSIFSGLLINILAFWAVFSFSRSLGLTATESLYFNVFLLSVYFGNLAAYPLYFPSDFFGWGQIGFYLFVLWVAWFINKSVWMLVVPTFFLTWLHPVFGVLASGVIFFYGTIERRVSYLLLSLLNIIFGAVFFGDLDLSSFDLSANPINSVVFTESDWAQNTHHILNISSIDAGLLSLCLLGSFYVLRAGPSSKIASIYLLAVCVFILIILGSSSSLTSVDIVENIVFRANFGRYYNLFILASILGLYLFFIRRCRNQEYRKLSLYLTFAAPVPVYWGVPSSYLHVFVLGIFCLLVLATLVSSGLLDRLINHSAVRVVLRNHFWLVLMCFVFAAASQIKPGHSYDGYHDVYSGELSQKLDEVGISSLVTPGYVHGVESFNVQIAANVPFWVPFPSELYCGKSRSNDYSNYVDHVRKCFSERLAEEWVQYCSLIGYFGIIDFSKNKLRINGRVVFEKDGIVVYDVCS